MKYPNAYKGVKILFWAGLLTFCSIVLSFPAIAGHDFSALADAGNMSTPRHICALVFLLAGEALVIIGFCVAAREGQSFRVAKWFMLIKLPFVIACNVIRFFLPSLGTSIPAMLDICGNLCQLFACYCFANGIICIACSLADRVTLTMMELSRTLLIVTYGLDTASRVMTILITSSQAHFGLSVVNLLASFASSVIFMGILFHIYRMYVNQKANLVKTEA